MKRRAALQLGGPMLLAMAAGCSLPRAGGSSGIILSRVTFRNRLDRAVRASLLITDGEEIVLWRTVTVSTAPDQFVTIDELPVEVGEYTLYAHIPDTDAGDAVRGDLVEDADGQSCIEVTLEVVSNRQDGADESTLVYGSIGECENQNLSPSS